MVATYSLFNSVINRLITNNILFLNSISSGNVFVSGTLERLVYKWHVAVFSWGAFVSCHFS